ncbi:MAG TPA: FkbM family methyltransferase [Edaphocola sp.]|nr:FkbM family methyltransferase [Edaphocola sp.]
MRYDNQTEKIIKILSKKGKANCCVDVGVLDGEIIDLFLKYIPHGSIHGIEPIPQKIEYLKKKFRFNTNVKLHEFAAGNKNESGPFNLVSSNPSYSGLKKRDYPKLEKIETVKVKIRKLDDILNNEEKIDLIKIDVEGGEYDVLLGANKILTNFKPVLIFEFGLGAANHYGIDAKKMYSLLAKYNYKIYTLSNWIKKRNDLTQEAFDESFRTNKHYYFIAE